MLENRHRCRVHFAPRYTPHGIYVILKLPLLIYCIKRDTKASFDGFRLSIKYAWTGAHHITALIKGFSQGQHEKWLHADTKGLWRFFTPSNCVRVCVCAPPSIMWRRRPRAHFTSEEFMFSGHHKGKHSSKTLKTRMSRLYSGLA